MVLAHVIVGLLASLLVTAVSLAAGMATGWALTTGWIGGLAGMTASAALMLFARPSRPGAHPPGSGHPALPAPPAGKKPAAPA